MRKKHKSSCRWTIIPPVIIQETDKQTYNFVNMQISFGEIQLHDITKMPLWNRRIKAFHSSWYFPKSNSVFPKINLILCYVMIEVYRRRYPCSTDTTLKHIQQLGARRHLLFSVCHPFQHPLKPYTITCTESSKSKIIYCHIAKKSTGY